jgi:hypothetical protein
MTEVKFSETKINLLEKAENTSNSSITEDDNKYLMVMVVGPVKLLCQMILMNL